MSFTGGYCLLLKKKDMTFHQPKAQPLAEFSPPAVTRGPDFAFSDVCNPNVPQGPLLDQDMGLWDAVVAESKEYVRAQDLPDFESEFFWDSWTASYDEMAASFARWITEHSSFRRFWSGSKSLFYQLSTGSKAYRRIRSKGERIRWIEEKSQSLDRVIRARTLHHNGSDPLLRKPHSKGKFMKQARSFKPPTDTEIKGNIGQTNTSDHPFAASARHLIVTKLRKACVDAGLKQFDPNVSSYARDKGVVGTRPIHTLKDLGHVPTPDSDNPEAVGVVSLIDCIGYNKDDLRQYAGNHIVLVASFYPELSGSGVDSIYYADSEDTFVEIVGSGTNGKNDRAGARYDNQTAWEFNCNDITYIESRDRSSYTTYQVITYPMPNILKQVVFLVALQTVHIPYAIMELCTQYVKGHSLSSTGIRPIGPCRNVKLYKRNPDARWTKDILVMSCGTPSSPRLSFKYLNDKGPDSSVIVRCELFNLFNYIQNSGKRGQTLTELQNALRYHMTDNYGQEVSMAKTAVLAEFMKVSLDFEPLELPNVVYYDIIDINAPVVTPIPPMPIPTPTPPALSPSTSAVPPPSPPAPRMHVGAPVEHQAARAVSAGPKITNGTNPGVFVKDVKTAEVYKTHRMDFYQNKTEPPSGHKSLCIFIVKQFINNVEKETGMLPKSMFLPSFQEVEATRTKPLQRARAEVYGRNGETPTDCARIEQKNEVAHKIVLPRGITCLEYKLGIYSGMLGKLLKGIVGGCSWFNPGCTPTEIADAVQACAKKGAAAAAITPSVTSGGHAADYSKMDETHSEFTNTFTKALISHFTHPNDVDKAMEIYDNLFNMPAKIKSKDTGSETTSTGWKNSSGSGITTELNTIVSAIREMTTTAIAMVLPYTENVQNTLSRSNPLTKKAFLAAMMKAQKGVYKNVMIPEDEGQLLRMAYRSIGPKFGDDSLDPATEHVSDATWLKCSQYLSECDGMKTEVDFMCTTPNNIVPWEYLSRIYPNPIASGTSHCKIVKALDKLCISLNSDADRYAMKCRGYWTVDSKTPVVNAYLKAMSKIHKFELSPLDSDQQTLEELYYYDRDLFYKVQGGAFPHDEQTEHLLIECASKQLQFTGGELLTFMDDMSKCRTRKELSEFVLPSTEGQKIMIDPRGTIRVPAASGMTTLEVDTSPEPDTHDARSNQLMVDIGAGLS